MGTSASSNGPGAGVSLDPSWLNDIIIPNTDISESPQIPIAGESDQNQEGDVLNEKPAISIAPKARFGNARRALGDYVRSGNRESLHRALGHYSRTGMGGASRVSNRMRTSSKTASAFFNTFRSLRDNQSFPLGSELALLKSKGASASEIIDTIIKYVCPNGGSIDEISCRDSGVVTLSEFMDNNPDADLCGLSDDQIWELSAMYLGNEIFNRVQLDIGQAFEKQDIPYTDRISRLNDMHDYIQSEIAVQVDKLRNNPKQEIDMNRFFQEAIKNTFEVFEVEI